MVALFKQPEAISETGLRLVEMDPRQPRRDALPEHTNYRDSGCDLHPSCLSCPLVRCRYDEPGGARQLLSRDRDREVITLQRHGGRSIEQIARHVGVSRRTVFRILARARSHGGRS
jgi:transposase-like protein